MKSVVGVKIHWDLEWMLVVVVNIHRDLEWILVVGVNTHRDLDSIISTFCKLCICGYYQSRWPELGAPLSFLLLYTFK